MRDYKDVINDRYEKVQYDPRGYGQNKYAVCNPVGYYSYIHNLGVVSDFINMIVSDKHQKIKLLDIGCGGGAVTRMMWEVLGGIYGEVYGLDGSQNKIEHCKLMNPSIDYVVHDIVNKFPYEFRFDGITSFVVLMHLRRKEDIEKALGNIYNALNDGGMFLWHDPNVETHFADFDSDGVGYSVTEMDSFAEKAGFKLIKESSLFKYLPSGEGSTIDLVDGSNYIESLTLDKTLNTAPVMNVRIYKK